MSERNEELFAEVSIFSGLDRTLHYRVPEDLREGALIGARVLVPLGRREASGLILSLGTTPPVLAESITIRPISAILDSIPVIPPDLLDLCRWISNYYFYP